MTPDLLPLALFTGDAPLAVDLIYAQVRHDDNHFPGLYHPAAQLYMHLRMVPVILLAARLLWQRHGWRLKINDCFRSVEAQARMAAYAYPPELVSLPGNGAHPRGMAVDVEAINDEGDLIPMGTPFDFFAMDLMQNPASRAWADFGPPLMSTQIIANRAALDAAMFDAARICGEDLIGLPDEWWDFRFPAAVYESYPALSEANLPSYMLMTATPAPVPDAVMAQWQDMRAKILVKLPKIAD